MDKNQIQLPTPKYKQGDHVWYVRDEESVFKRAYICSWKMVIYSYGQSMIYYTVEYDDPDSDDDDFDAGCDYDVAENRLYDNALDALRKQLELWSSEHGQQQHIMEGLDELRAEIMQKILVLEQEEETNAKHS